MYELRRAARYSALDTRLIRLCGHSILPRGMVVDRELGFVYVAIEGEVGVVRYAAAPAGGDVLNVPLGPDYPMGLLVVQDGANDPQVVVQDEGALENISTNFKFVPWPNVANAFPQTLLVDPFSFNPRGSLTERLDLLLEDVQALVRARELSRPQAFGLTLVLQGARSLVAQGPPRVAIWLLHTCVGQVKSLERANRLEQGIAASLARSVNGIIRTIQQAP